MSESAPILHLYDVRFTEHVRVSTLILAGDPAEAKRKATAQWHRHCDAAINQGMATTAVLGFADASRFDVVCIRADYPVASS